MTKPKRPKSELTPQELAEQRAERLPDREAMALVDLNVAIPVDAAIAAHVLSDESVADADADQEAEIEQATGPESPQEEE